MTWSASGVFAQWNKSILGAGQTALVLPAGYAGLGADTVKVSLFNSTPTPDKDAALAATGYNTGQWVTSSEVTDANWAAAGRTLAGKAITAPGSGVAAFDATDLAGGGNMTVAGVHGCFVYDDTITAGSGGVAKQGICFNYFGGAQAVSGGTFTIVWHANGLFRITSS